MSTFDVNILGCGSAKPTLRHVPSCTVLNICESLYMIDCGEGTQIQMQHSKLKFQRLNNIFLTHLHGDHVLGLPGLLSTLSLQGKEGYVTVYSFERGIEWLKAQMEFFGGDLSYDLRFVEVNPFKPQQVYEDKHFTVRSIPLDHRVPCVGYVFEEKPKPRHIDKAMCDFHGVPVKNMQYLQAGMDFVKPDGTVIPNVMLTKAPSPSVSYAHIGDTAYKPALAQQIGPVDLLYHETTYTMEHEADAKKRGHSTAAQAAMMAKACGAKWLLTGHYSSRYKDDRVFLNEASAIFPNTILGREGLKIKLNTLLDI
ncbi:MAG: ribonuclease Z [Muribaculaceae bacterium]|nr:ribonuclease Z [Muribaculaceae bacterium]